MSWIIRQWVMPAMLLLNAKRSDVRKILKVASTYAVELHELWKAMNGRAY